MNVKKMIEQMTTLPLSIIPILILTFGFIYFAQNWMIFHNTNDPESRIFLRDRPGFREVVVTAESGKTYHGMMYQASSGKAPLVIYFGGNAEVSYTNLLMRELLDQWGYFAGYHYLFVDYEGYGFNRGRASYLNMYEQSLAVFDYAVALPNVDSSRIVAMGFSLGTGSAVHLAANRPVAGLIIVAPFANGYDLYNNVLPIFFGPMRLLVRQKLPSDEFAPKVTSPVLIIASRGDEIVPFSSSERLAKLFPGQVGFMKLDRVRHNFIFQPSVFVRIQSFLESIASK